MYLLDDAGAVIDAECSFDLFDGHPSIVVESSGGANPSRSITRRNPDYNRLLAVLLRRLGSKRVQLTGVFLESKRVQSILPDERLVKAPEAYPIALSDYDSESLRLSLQREAARMHRAPAAVSGGNSQKRLRLCLDRSVSVEDVVFPATTPADARIVPDITEGLTSTEREYVRAARVGQGAFRLRLMQEFSGRCPLTGIENPSLLKASHIKPWSKSTNAERLDPSNGLLLSALADALFDSGLLTFSEEGVAQLSPQLKPSDRTACGCESWPAIAVTSGRARFLAFHRGEEFSAS